MLKGNDEQLIVSYLKGDEKSLESLVRQYLKPIYSFVCRYVGNVHDAEDITQEVFVRMWRNLKKPALSLSKGFNPKKGSFKTWIFTIAKNTCLDWRKKKRAIPFSELERIGEGRSFVENIPDNNLLPNELLERIDTANFLNKALEKLSPKYRMVLFLRYNDHFTFREIAETLGEPLNTIKSRHRRALVKLKKLLSDS